MQRLKILLVKNQQKFISHFKITVLQNVRAPSIKAQNADISEGDVSMFKVYMFLDYISSAKFEDRYKHGCLYTIGYVHVCICLATDQLCKAKKKKEWLSLGEIEDCF